MRICALLCDWQSLIWKNDVFFGCVLFFKMNEVKSKWITRYFSASDRVVVCVSQIVGTFSMVRAVVFVILKCNVIFIINKLNIYHFKLYMQVKSKFRIRCTSHVQNAKNKIKFPLHDSILVHKRIWSINEHTLKLQWMLFYMYLLICVKHENVRLELTCRVCDHSVSH